MCASGGSYDFEQLDASGGWSACESGGVSRTHENGIDLNRIDGQSERLRQRTMKVDFKDGE